MKDRNGNELKPGDWVVGDDSFSIKARRVKQQQHEPHGLIMVWVPGWNETGWYYPKELKKISEQEAMIYLLEI